MAEEQDQTSKPAGATATGVSPGGSPGGTAVRGKGRGAGKSNGAAAKGAPAAGQKAFLPDIHFELPPWIARRLQPRLPGLAVLFQRDALVLVQVERGKGGAKPVVTHASHHQLPDGTLVPGLMEPNFKSPAETSARLGRALDCWPAVDQ